MTHSHHMPLRELYVSDDAASALRAEALKLPGWRLDASQTGALTLLMNGGFAPLRGYMSEADHRAAQDREDGPWPVPLALQVGADFAGDVQPGCDIALRDADEEVLAVMSVTDKWGDPVLLGGKVKGLRRPAGGETPNSLRALFRERGCTRVLAVQPDHADRVAPAARLARQMDAALLIQPLPGVAVDLPAGAVLAPLPVIPPPGPRSVLWQGLVARNHGATHVVPGGDPEAWDLYRRHQDRIGAQMVVPEGTL
ncbi:transcription antiterminator BlgG [Paracoccus benzoatiresistens]|uniref:Transcription antiterminator BlgG n=1 Tax=Paracoccus benzoatiresistens TaxID=2997341 RepID=A0ABT4J6Q5_9RHOB|nr:transcription antiterminator BlgG [Paracoccus sp. EF6]MCZ0962800.1 transcription antiterminator BlgG [Paracoccus sp. EF6]